MRPPQLIPPLPLFLRLILAVCLGLRAVWRISLLYHSCHVPSIRVAHSFVPAPQASTYFSRILISRLFPKLFGAPTFFLDVVFRHYAPLFFAPRGIEANKLTEQSSSLFIKSRSQNSFMFLISAQSGGEGTDRTHPQRLCFLPLLLFRPGRDI